MPDARWMELCLDTAHASPDLGRFWAAVIGGELENTSDDPAGNVVVRSAGDGKPVAGLGLAICPVPEVKTVKHRVHLDVYAASLSDLETLGATVLLPAEESGFGWTVLTDPEGGEFCAFLRDPLPAYRLHGVGVDCADPGRLAQWWGQRFGVEADDNNDGRWWTLPGVLPDPALTLDFAPVPEPRAVKNRLHWDVYGDPATFLAAGATHLWDTRKWTVLADPEGNEFCVFPEP